MDGSGSDDLDDGEGEDGTDPFYMSDNPGPRRLNDDYFEDYGGDNDDDDDDDDFLNAERGPKVDLLQQIGDRYYVASTHGGLSVVDLSEPGSPRWKRKDLYGIPFDLVIEENHAVILVNGRGSYEQVEQGFQWQEKSRLFTLDLTDPESVDVIAEIELPGVIRESQRSGNILHVVTHHDDGPCAFCPAPQTVVTSIDISDPSLVHVVESVGLDLPEGQGLRRPQPVALSSERVYIAQLDAPDDFRALIQVVDISDPDGAIRLGAALPIYSEITNGWQMAETDGVLRIFSQANEYFDSSGQVETDIETFQIVSSDSVEPMSRVLRGDEWWSDIDGVWSAGDWFMAAATSYNGQLRGFNVEDPANPVEVSGWGDADHINHVEVREHRIFTSGFDRRNDTITTSLFDVSNPTQAMLLDEVGFARRVLHPTYELGLNPAFELSDESDLLVVPFHVLGLTCSSMGGVYFIEHGGDTLTSRGFADGDTVVRRTFRASESLTTLGDDSLQIYDVSNLDQPVQEARLPLANRVFASVADEDLLVRLVYDWVGSEPRLEVVDRQQADDPRVLGTISFDGLLSSDSCAQGIDAELVAREGLVYVVYSIASPLDSTETHLEIVDIRDPLAPTHVGSLVIDKPFGGSSNSFAGLEFPTTRIALLGDTVVIAGATVDSGWTDDAFDHYYQSSTGWFTLVDVRDPAVPVLDRILDRSDAVAHGWLQVVGDTLVSWHAEAVNETISPVAFQLERL